MRMILATLLVSAFTAAYAQDAAPVSHDGTWAMTGANSDGRSFDAELVLEGDGGTWRLYSRGGSATKSNPCLMKKFPVTVQKSTGQELTFHVDGPKVIAGCNEFTATLRRVDDSSFDGTLDGTWTAHLARK